jgi:hypothetical protein
VSLSATGEIATDDLYGVSDTNSNGANTVEPLVSIFELEACGYPLALFV